MEVKPVENYGEDDTWIDDVTVEYFQNPDCTQSDMDLNKLTVFTQNNGVARFISFSTERWSISDIDELVDLLKDFKARACLEDKGEN